MLIWLVSRAPFWPIGSLETCTSTRLARLQRVLDLARLALTEGAPVDLAGIQDGVAAGTDVDERGLHAGQHVLHLAEVDVADQRRLRLASDVVLDQHVVFEDDDLGVVVLDVGAHVLANHHLPLDRFAAGEELGLRDDGGAPTAWPHGPRGDAASWLRGGLNR